MDWLTTGLAGLAIVFIIWSFLWTMGFAKRGQKPPWEYPDLNEGQEPVDRRRELRLVPLPGAGCISLAVGTTILKVVWHEPMGCPAVVVLQPVYDKATEFRLRVITALNESSDAKEIPTGSRYIGSLIVPDGRAVAYFDEGWE